MNPDTSTAKHSSITKVEVSNFLIRHAISHEEEVAIQKVVDLAIPPPTLSKVEQIAETLYDFNYVPTDCYEQLRTYLLRNQAKGLLQSKHFEETYPLGTTILKLSNKLSKNRDYLALALEQTLKLHNDIATPSEFSGGLFYTHLLAFRDSYLHFWENTSQYQEFQVDIEGLLLHLDSAKKDPLVSNHNQNKFTIAASLVRRELQLGARQRYGSSGGRSSGKLVFAVDRAIAISLEEKASYESATVNEVFQSESDDDTGEGLSVLVSLPEGSTSKDKRSITERAITGFGRSNVYSKADMRSLSRNTYADFLNYVYEKANKSIYALNWLAAFAGFDVSRPIRVPSARVPLGEEALLRLTSHTLTYRVIRRLTQDDPHSYESAGVMELALPKYVAEGLSEMVSESRQGYCIDASNKLARKYSNTNPGLTPTLRRLKNSATLHVGLAHMTQLELCALGGRVFPALKGKSAYYPVNVNDLTTKFRIAYAEACETLNIAAPDYQNRQIKGSPHKYIFTERKNHTNVVKTLLREIGQSYTTKSKALSARGLLATTNEVIDAIQIHEVARYVLQQYLFGVRPIGKIANLQISDSKHVIVWDKGSRLFSERSYTPLNKTLRKFIQASNENRYVLKSHARARGIDLILDQPQSGLAMRIRPSRDMTSITMSRFTNDFFRHAAPIASTRVDALFPFNWLRKAATEELEGAAPQWLLDELFGHRLCGREAFGIWSSIDARAFQRLDEILSDLTRMVLPQELQNPISLSHG